MNIHIHVCVYMIIYYIVYMYTCVHTIIYYIILYKEICVCVRTIMLLSHKLLGTCNCTVVF